VFPLWIRRRYLYCASWCTKYWEHHLKCQNIDLKNIKLDILFPNFHILHSGWFTKIHYQMVHIKGKNQHLNGCKSWTGQLIYKLVVKHARGNMHANYCKQLHFASVYSTVNKLPFRCHPRDSIANCTEHAISTANADTIIASKWYSIPTAATCPQTKIVIPSSTLMRYKTSTHKVLQSGRGCQK